MRQIAAGTLLLAFVASSHAWAAKDCAPVGVLPGYAAAAEATTYSYAAANLSTKDADGSEKPISVAGATCQTSYRIPEGATPMSNLEIQENYLDQLRKIGAEILWTDGRWTYAHLAQGDIWLGIYASEDSVEVSTVRKQDHVATLLPPSGPDHRLIGHMPGFVPGTAEKRNFDEMALTVEDNGEAKEIKPRGARFTLTYTLLEGKQPPSDLDIQTNFRKAFTTQGAQIVSADGRNTVARFEIAGQTIWARISSGETSYEVAVLEEKAFQPSIRPPEPAALEKALQADGHVALYVPFDFDKSTLKPEAAPVIAQLVKLLKDAPTLKLTLEGHTDSFGKHDYNQALSDARAKAVMAAVVAAGISADRLSATGRGPDVPLADNATPEGRTKNRRVELVRQ